MAPRRNNNSSQAGLALDLQHLILDQTVDSSFDSSNNSDNMDANNNVQRCCVPTGECLKANTMDFGLIHMDDLADTVRITCTNENCNAGQYMHRECFEQWEESILPNLKTGRARAWNDKQRQQNLWTKKGYDLIYKLCGCRCGRGHIKKDLDWIPPVVNNSLGGRLDDEATKKKKKRNRNNQKPALTLTSSSPNAYHPNNQMMKLSSNIVDNMMSNLLDQTALTVSTPQSTIRGRAGSLSSSNGSSSPPVSSSEQSISPVHSTAALLKQKQKEQVEIYSDRVRATSGANGIFSRRLDFSSFNVLPKQRINSYSIKIEDEGNHGNDETRLFILSSLAAQHKSRVACILCEEPMLVFDRYPLVDGTFFLSPKQHNKGCIEVKYEQRSYYLTAVCMECLEGVVPEKIFRCRFCAEKWDGSSLVMGTMYSYDIFAAMPCCTERLKCNNCFKLLLLPHQRLNFFSDYSHSVTCPYCSAQDTHFIKPLNYCYTNKPLQQFQQWP